MPNNSKSGPTGRWRPLLRKVGGPLFLLGVVGAGAWALQGHTAELSASVVLIQHAELLPLLGAVLAEMASVAAFGIFTWRLLGVGVSSPSLLKTVAIATANTTINNTVPGGTAFASVYTFRQFRGMGADSVFASWVILAVNLLAAVALGALAVLGVVMSLRASQGLDLFIFVPLVSVALFGMAALFASPRTFVKVARPPMQAGARVINRFRSEPLNVEDAISKVSAISTTRSQVMVAIVWAIANWVMDALVLALAYVAIGGSVPWTGILLAYGAGQLAANLPVTPGGLGVVEGSLSIALVAYGGAQEPAVAAVLLYRLISFWMIIPFGWLSYFGTTAARRRANIGAAGGISNLEGGVAS